MNLLRIAARVAAVDVAPGAQAGPLYYVYSHLHDPSGDWHDPEWVADQLEDVRAQFGKLESRGGKVVGFQAGGDFEDFMFIVSGGVEGGKPVPEGSTEWTPWPQGVDPAQVAWDNYVGFTFSDEEGTKAPGEKTGPSMAEQVAKLLGQPGIQTVL